MARKIAAGNWKMNGTAAALTELEALAAAFPQPPVEVLICPPATLLSRAAAVAGPIMVGGQDCHTGTSGAHTGDTSAAMLKDAGASAVILGHSERRTDHGETSALVAAKAEAAWAEGLTAVICIGESLEERDAGTTLSVIDAQIAGSLPSGANPDNTVIAYEPIWAIGTGKIPTMDQIAEVHDHLRTKLSADLSLLYGGSVKASNATEIFALTNVNGALVGGASLKAAYFAPIVEALAAS